MGKKAIKISLAIVAATLAFTQVSNAVNTSVYKVRITKNGKEIKGDRLPPKFARISITKNKGEFK